MQESFVNGAIVALGRESQGLTQEDLAKRVGVSQSAVSKIEDGKLGVTNSLATALAEVLQVSPQILSDGSLAVTTATVSMFRKTVSLPARQLNRIVAQVHLRRIEIEVLAREVGIPPAEVPKVNPKEFPNGAAGVANYLRSVLGLPSGPIKNLTGLIESLGVVVVEHHFGSTKFDGVSFWAPTGIPMIFINAEFPTCRKRLTLAHELGHLVMHSELRPEIEVEAWDFAGEFLMPESEIKNRLFPLTIETLGVLKRFWGVSMQAVITRARKLGRVNERYERVLWLQMGKLGYRLEEPYEDQIPKEAPTKELLWRERKEALRQKP